MTTVADLCFIRTNFAKMLMLAAIVSLGGVLYAQPDMLVTHTGNVILDGDDYNFTPIKGATAPMGFVIENNGATDLNITLLTLSSNPQNCTVSFQSTPSAVIAPGNTSSFAVTLSTPDSGNYSFNVSIDNDDPDSNPYTFVVEGNVPGGGGGAASSGGGGGGGGCIAQGGGENIWLLIAILAAELVFFVRIGMFRLRDDGE